MDILDDRDPIVLLQNQIQSLLIGHDGATVLAALALSLSASIALVQSRVGGAPSDIYILREDLLSLTAALVQARNIQRES